MVSTPSGTDGIDLVCPQFLSFRERPEDSLADDKYNPVILSFLCFLCPVVGKEKCAHTFL